MRVVEPIVRAHAGGSRRRARVRLRGALAALLLVPAIGATSEWEIEPHERADPTVVSPGLPLFEEVQPFQVMAKRRNTDLQPCWGCHYWTESNPEPRPMEWVHDDFRLQHGLEGKGEFWCFTCHHLEGNGGLRTLEGAQVGFQEAYVLCAQCHTRQTRDWTFGGHGKRVSGWGQERVVLDCTVCHDEHHPALAPRGPQPQPLMRHGLERAPVRPPLSQQVWERREALGGER